MTLKNTQQEIGHGKIYETIRQTFMEGDYDYITPNVTVTGGVVDVYCAAKEPASISDMAQSQTNWQGYGDVNPLPRYIAFIFNGSSGEVPTIIVEGFTCTEILDLGD